MNAAEYDATYKNQYNLVSNEFTHVEVDSFEWRFMWNQLTLIDLNVGRGHCPSMRLDGWQYMGTHYSKMSGSWLHSFRNRDLDGKGRHNVTIAARAKP